MRTDADERKRAVAWDVSFEGIAVVTRESAGPVALVGGPNCRLHSESLLDREDVDDRGGCESVLRLG